MSARAADMSRDVSELGRHTSVFIYPVGCCSIQRVEISGQGPSSINQGHDWPGKHKPPLVRTDVVRLVS